MAAAGPLLGVEPRVLHLLLKVVNVNKLLLGGSVLVAGSVRVVPVVVRLGMMQDETRQLQPGPCLQQKQFC